jgi:hypothetical protein
MSNKKPKYSKPRYEVREYLGKFEHWLLVMRGRNTFLAYDRLLERLLSMYPKYVGWEQFTSIDIADYEAARIRQGVSSYSLMMELRMFFYFWKWLIEDCGATCWNPARAYRNWRYDPKLRTKRDLCLADIDRLLEHLVSVKDKRTVLEIMAGGKVPSGKARKSIIDAAIKAEIPGFSMRQLKSTFVSRLAKDVVQRYCEQVLNALPVETESDSNSFAAIKLPTLDEGTSVTDGYDYTTTVSGVNQE